MHNQPMDVWVKCSNKEPQLRKDIHVNEKKSLVQTVTSIRMITEIYLLLPSNHKYDLLTSRHAWNVH